MSVSQFVEYLNTALATAVFPEGVTIEGEVAEYRVSQDKWIWFALKDATAVVSCFSTVWQMRTPLEDGMQVRVIGTPKVHPKSGKFSITVERVELVGEGALRRAYELLKKKLAEEGLFAAARKRPIPRFPERIGLIASRESAAYTDFLRILGDRWGGVTVHALHVQVQGAGAIPDIALAFRHFNSHPELAEVIVLTRGGGSLEDLQAFNSEEVARAVFGSLAPVVVGVGHERDETLTDLAADVRASTPTNAAERVAPDRREIAGFVDGVVARAASSLRGGVTARLARLDAVTSGLEARVRERLTDAVHILRDFAASTHAFSARLGAMRLAVAALAGRAGAGISAFAGRTSAELTSRERLLVSLDPRALLKRGYAVVRRGGGMVKDAATLDIGEKVGVQLWRGEFSAEVTDIKKL